MSIFSRFKTENKNRFFVESRLKIKMPKLNCTLNVKGNYGLQVSLTNDTGFTFIFTVPYGPEMVYFPAQKALWKSLAEGKICNISTNDVAFTHARIKPEHWGIYNLISLTKCEFLVGKRLFAGKWVGFNVRVMIEPEAFMFVNLPYEDCEEAFQMLYNKLDELDNF